MITAQEYAAQVMRCTHCGEWAHAVWDDKPMCDRHYREAARIPKTEPEIRSDERERCERLENINPEQLRRVLKAARKHIDPVIQYRLIEAIDNLLKELHAGG